MRDVSQQTLCDRCKSPLEPDAAYCFKCGERTRGARRMVRLAIRVEILIVALMFFLVIGFALIYSAQR